MILMPLGNNEHAEGGEGKKSELVKVCYLSAACVKALTTFQ